MGKLVCNVKTQLENSNPTRFGGHYMGKVHDGQMSLAAVFAGNGQGKLTSMGKAIVFFQQVPQRLLQITVPSGKMTLQWKINLLMTKSSMVHFPQLCYFLPESITYFCCPQVPNVLRCRSSLPGVQVAARIADLGSSQGAVDALNQRNGTVTLAHSAIAASGGPSSHITCIDYRLYNMYIVQTRQDILCMLDLLYSLVVYHVVSSTFQRLIANLRYIPATK